MSHSRTPVGRLGVDPRALVVELVVAVGMLLALGAYVNLADAVVGPAKDVVDASTGIDRHLAGSVVRGAIVLAGLGGLAAVAASARDLKFPLSVPERDAAGLVAVATLGAVVLAVVPVVPAAIGYGLTAENVAAAVTGLPADLFDRTLIFLGVFVAGMAVLYHGLVQGLARRTVGREREIAATTLLSAYFVTPQFGPSFGGLRGGPWLTTSADGGAVAVLVVVTAVVVVYANERIDDRRVRAVSAAPLLLAVGVAAVTLWQGIEWPWEALSVATRVALVGVAAYAYADTESLLAPALVYGTYGLVGLVVQSAALYAIIGA